MAIRSARKHDLRHGVGQLAKPRFALVQGVLRPFCFGYIHDGADQTDRPASIPFALEVRLAVCLHPAHRAVGVDDAVFQRKRIGIFQADRGVGRRFDFPPVLGMNRRIHILLGEFHPDESKDHPEPLIHVDLAFYQIEVPPAHLRRVQGKPPLLS